MVQYTCDRCGFNCIYKNNFRKHITRKHPCKAKLKDIPVEDIQNKYNITSNKKKTDIKKNLGKGFQFPLSTSEDAEVNIYLGVS
jgi:hypothetical protein